MELTVNFRPAAEFAKASVNLVNNSALSIAEYISNQAGKVNEYLFDDTPEAAFTLSAFGTLAVATCDPSLLTVGFGTTVFSSILLECKAEGVNFVNFDGETQEVSDQPAEGSKELAAINEEALNEARSDNLYNLAITNSVMTLASEAIFGDNRLGIASLAVTTAVRLMQ